MPKFPATTTNTYRSLVENVSRDLDALEFLIKRSTAGAYWKVGKYIDDHLLVHKDRAGYGEALYIKLSKDVGRDVSTLQRTVQFYRMYPNSVPGRNLTWGHYRRLITVKDAEERKKLEAQILQKKWKTEDVQRYLNAKRKLSHPADVSPLRFTPGKLHTY